MGNRIVHQVGTALRGLYTLKLVQKSEEEQIPPLPQFNLFRKAGIHFPILYQSENDSAVQSIFFMGQKD